MTGGTIEKERRVLVVEDDEAGRDFLAESLGRRGFSVAARGNAEDALADLAKSEVDVVLTDLRLGKGATGVELCQRVSALRPGVPVIVVTAFGSNESALDAIGAGAWDFLTKPFDLDVVAVALERAVRHSRLTREVARLRSETDGDALADDLVGTSEAMRRVRELVSRLADSDATVLVAGESGTGKELVARALHGSGRRRNGPFTAINCAALPEPLLESELFGHARGAFTDARAARAGLFVRASSGTLFLDEVGEMPQSMQAKLLRALEERRVRPVGSDTEVPYDARIVAATNRDLEREVREGRFREDLYYRLAVVHVDVPALRERREDVPLLARALLERVVARSEREIHGFSADAAATLSAYAWPGNVRELANSIEHAVALARGERIEVSDLPERLRKPRSDAPPGPGASDGSLLSLDEIERRHILRVLDAVGGKRGRAAEILGVDRKTLYRKLERWGVSQENGSA